MSIQKLVLKGTGKMSLHDRFTQLQFIETDEDWDGMSSVRNVKSEFGLFDRHRKMFQDRDRAETVGPTYNFRTKMRDQSPVVERSSNFLRRSEPVRNYNSMKLYTPSATMVAANRIKKKSIFQRLGVRSRVGVVDNQARFSNYVPRRSAVSEARWGNSGGSWSGGVRRWNGFRRQGRFDNRRVGRWLGGGYQRRWGQGGRFRGRGRGGMGGRRHQQPPPNRDQLDKELDSYMAGTKSVLDKEMDDYRTEAGS